MTGSKTWAIENIKEQLTKGFEITDVAAINVLDMRVMYDEAEREIALNRAQYPSSIDSTLERFGMITAHATPLRQQVGTPEH